MGTESDTSGGVSIEMPEILRRIPHRYPFLLVDRCEDYVAAKSITGIKCVTMNEEFFVGHFPGDPIMPGVLIVEALAQTGAILMSKTIEADVSRTTIFFASAENCRFRSPVRPGAVLSMKVEVVRARGLLFKFRGRAFVGERLAAEADWTAMAVTRDA